MNLPGAVVIVVVNGLVVAVVIVDVVGIACVLSTLIFPLPYLITLKLKLKTKQILLFNL